MEAAGLAIGVPGLAALLLEGGLKGYEFVTTARAFSRDTDHYRHGFEVERKWISDWKKQMDDLHFSDVQKEAEKERLLLICKTLALIYKLFDQRGTSLIVVPQTARTKSRASFRRLLKPFRTRPGNPESRGDTPANSTAPERNLEGTASPELKINEMTPTSINADEVRRIGERIENMKDSAFSFSGIKWALTDQARTDQLLKRLREYNEQLKRLSESLVQYRAPDIPADMVERLSAQNAAFDSAIWENRPYCMEGTRTGLLKGILDWSRTSDPSASTPTIFWLNGMAGTGKSTIARTIARECQNDERLGASFFFSKGHNELSNANMLFTTIAVQLARSIPGLRSLIYEAINDKPDIHTKGLADQWRHLILQPIATLDEKSASLQQPHVVVIDALDECEGENIVSLIPFLLYQAAALTHNRLRIFITSRPEVSIKYGFSSISTRHRRDFVLHDMSLGVVEGDIFAYLSSEFAEIRSRHSIPLDWPGNETIQLMARKSMGLFIYAATICRFLGHTKFDPVESLEEILQDTPHPSSTEHLDAMYNDVLKRSVMGGCPKSRISELSERFRLIVGSLVVLFSPLTATSISELLGERPGRTNALLKCLYSVLELPDTSSTFQQIRLVHPSFRDFLLSNERRRDPLFHVHERKAHEILFFRCLELMQKKLRCNICDLHPGDSANKANTEKFESALPQSLQYACRYWIHHLMKSVDGLKYEDEVYLFLQDHFLHWLEALGLMKMISEGINAVRMLESKVPNTIKRSKLTLFYLANDQKVASSGSDRLHQLTLDSRRFVVKNRSAIEKAPLQAYISAMIFSPSSSIVRRLHGSSIPMWIRNSPQVQNDWDSLLQTLEGHSDYVRSVAFSPDGKLLASGSDDKTVWLWDAATGASRGILEGHSDYVRSVAFLPDGKLLASGSLDKTVRLWEVEKKESPEVFEMGSAVYDVSFSSDGTSLITNVGTKSLVSSPSVESKMTVSSHELWSMSDEWITYGSRKLVFVPVEFKGYRTQVHGNTVAWVDGGHKVNIMDFDPSALTE